MKGMVKNALVHACVYFTIAMALWLIVGFVFAGPVEGIVVSASILAACVLIAFLQSLWFTDRVMKRPGYPVRILGFGVCGIVALGACAWLGGWVPRAVPEAYITFAVIYLLLLVLFTVVFSFVYRNEVAKYSDALSRFKAKGSEGGQ